VVVMFNRCVRGCCVVFSSASGVPGTSAWSVRIQLSFPSTATSKPQFTFHDETTRKIYCETAYGFAVLGSSYSIRKTPYH
jgi:hypothetical protein